MISKQDVPEVQQAYEEYRRFKSNPVMQEKAKARERFLVDQHLNRIEAKEEGIAEGLVAGKKETATMMKKKGYPVAEIAEMTGLPLSEIEHLG